MSSASSGSSLLLPRLLLATPESQFHTLRTHKQVGSFPHPPVNLWRVALVGLVRLVGRAQVNSSNLALGVRDLGTRHPPMRFIRYLALADSNGPGVLIRE